MIGRRIGIGIGRRGGASWTPPNGLLFWGNERSGNELVDYFGENIDILTAYNVFNGSDDIAKTNALNPAVFNANVSGTYCEAVVLVESSVQNLFFSLSAAGHAYKRMVFEITVDGYLRMYYRDGTFTRDLRSTSALSNGWHIVKVESTGDAYDFYVDDNSVAVTVTTGANDGKWNLDAILPSIVSIGGTVNSGGTTFSRAAVARVRFGSTMQWVLNNKSYVFETGFPTSLGGDGQEIYGLKFSGTGDRIAYGTGDDYLLTYGYSIYVKEGDLDIEVPNNPSGEKLNTPIIGYTESYVVSGNNDGHNLCNSKIRFVNDFFDRSNTDIWNSDCRAASDYDVENTKDFHIDNINFKTLIGWLNEGYAGRVFPFVYVNSISDRDLLKEILLFEDDCKRTKEIQVLTYTGDIAEAVTDEGGNVLFDEYGYVLIN